MSVGGRVCGLFGSLLDILIRIIYLPITLFGFICSLLPLIFIITLLLSLGALSYYGAAKNGDVLIETIYNTVRCTIVAFYEENVKPILDFIVRIFNPLICWWDGFILWPQIIGRKVIFPVALDCGLLDTVLAFFNLLNAIFKDWLIDHVTSGAFFTEPLDFTNICDKWIAFWTQWQSFLCCGCMDLCTPWTQLPFIPMLFTSDQMSDPQLWCAVSNFMNGILVFLQEGVRIWRVVFLNTGGSRRPDFTVAFDRFCASSACFWRSWENILQKTWNAYVPYVFVWKDVLTPIDKMTCNWLKLMNIYINIIFQSDLILDFLTGNTLETYWSESIRYQFSVVMNEWTPLPTFDPIIEPIPGPVPIMNITHYNVPITGMYISDCMCKSIERILCDPADDGTTCAQKYNDTFLETIDFCCLLVEGPKAAVNMASYIFDMTLHIGSIQQFVVFIDRQPYTTFIKDAYISLLGCMFDVFQVIELYGKCLDNILTEIVTFMICMAELLMRVIIAFLTSFYFETQLPGIKNFITRPGNEALNMATAFLDRLADSTNPDGLVNCLCFIFNTGFPVPYAGCSNNTITAACSNLTSSEGRKTCLCNIVEIGLPSPPLVCDGATPTPSCSNSTTSDEIVNCICYNINQGFPVPPEVCANVTIFSNNTEPCMPTGFIDPNVVMTRRRKAENRMERIYRKYGVKHYMHSERGYHEFDFNYKEVVQNMDKSLDNVLYRNRNRNRNRNRYEDRLFTSPPSNETFGCETCFNLCCLPTNLIILASEGTTILFRAMNEAFQSRNGTGSGYWDGSDCTLTASGLTGICLASDVSTFISDLLSPLTCICNFINLVIPPRMGIDPCCLFERIGDLLACVAIILINIGNSVASDPNFTYIKDASMLQADFDATADIAVDALECGCNIIRVIFNFVQDVSGIGSLNDNFDPCCIPQKIFNTIIEVVKVLFRAVISLATLDQEESQCFLFIRSTDRPNCVNSINDLPIILQLDMIIETLLAPPAPGVYTQCIGSVDFDGGQTPIPQDQAIEGIATCYCTLIQNVFSALFKNSELANDCPLNLCCFIYKIGELIEQLLKFAFRLVASLLQTWKKEIIITNNGAGMKEVDVPEGFIDFFFCDEYYTDEPGGSIIIDSPNLNITGGVPNLGASNTNLNNSKCGKFEPVLTAFQEAASECFCSSDPLNDPAIGDIADNFLEWFFYFITTSNPTLFSFATNITWPRCLCQGGRTPFAEQQPILTDGHGIIRPGVKVITVALRQIIILVRNLPNPAYWKPVGGSLSGGNFSSTLTNNIEDVEKSWIGRFLAPFADALCEFITNMSCFLSLILGNMCERPRYNAVASIVRYLLEAIIKAIIVIEGFVKLFLQEAPGLCVGDQNVVADPNGPGAGLASDGGSMSAACAPSSAIGPIFGLDFSMTEQLSSILVAMTQFVFDAVLGVSVYGCSYICPTASFTVEAGMVQPNDTACSCYEKTPYKVSKQTSVSLEGCRLGLGLPDNETVCPPGETTCTLALACGNLPGDPTFIVYTPPTIETTVFFCRRSIYHNGSNIVAYDTGDPIQQERYRALDNWIYIMDEIAYFSIFQGPPTGCGLNENIISDPDANGTVVYLDPAYNGYSLAESTSFDPYVRYKAIKTFSHATSTWETSPIFGGYNWVPYIDPAVNPNGYCQLLDPMNMAPGPSDPVTQLVAILYGQSAPDGMNLDPNITRQSLCTRENCYMLGMCKNDQMVPCSQSPPGQLPLDGIAISFFKYVRCVVTEYANRDILSGGSGGLYGILKGVMDILLDILAIIWQLSAGIIKLVVSAAVLSMKFMLDFNPFTRFFTGFKIVLEFFENFFAIFSQPIIPEPGPDVRSQFTTTQYVHTKPKDFMYKIIEAALNVNLDGCIEDPIKCICEADITTECSATDQNYSIQQIFDFMAAIFDGGTNCDSLVQTLAQQTYMNWVDIPYSERFLYVDCIGKRIQGDKISKVTSGMWPSNFFYTPSSIYNTFMDLKEGVGAYTRRKDDTFNHNRRKTPRHDDLSHRDFYLSLIDRAELAKKHIGIPKSSLAYEFSIEMDRIWYKYTRGYYHYLSEQAGITYRTHGISHILGTYDDLYSNMRDSFTHIGRSVENSKKHVNRISNTFWELLPTTYWGTPKNVLEEEEKSEFDVYDHLGRGPHMPLNYEGPVNYYHLNDNVFNGNSMSGQVYGTSFDVNRIRWPRLRSRSVLDALLPGRPVWTDDQLYNYYSLKRLVSHISHYIMPQTFDSPDQYDERAFDFIYNANCSWINGTIEETAKIVDYCLNEFFFNLPNETVTPAVRSLRESSKMRTGSIFKKYGDSVHVTHYLGKNRLRHKSATARYNKLVAPHQHVFTERQTPPENGFGNGFNFIEWIISTIRSLLNINPSEKLSDITNSVNAWLSNPNILHKQRPDVGLAFYVRDLLICDFPEDLNCMYGIGIEEAIKRVTLVYLIAIALLWIAGLMSIIALIISPIVYGIIIMYVAYSWSPICANVFPSFTFGAGISIPLLPIPIGPWALPFCLWDDLFGVLNKYLSSCWDFLIPAALVVGGNVCPACPEQIDIINCVEIGMGDGISNLLYLLFRWFGPVFCDVIISLSITTIGRLWPGLNAYLINTLDAFKNATPDEITQFNFCSVITSGTIFIVLVFFVLLGFTILYIIPQLYGLLVSLFGFFQQTNIYEALSNQGEPTSYDEIPGDEPASLFEEEEEEEDLIEGQINRRRRRRRTQNTFDAINGYMGNIIRYIIPKKKQE